MNRGLALGLLGVVAASSLAGCGNSGSTSSVCAAISKDGHSATETLIPAIKSGSYDATDAKAIDTIANVLSTDGAKASNSGLKSATAALAADYRQLATAISTKNTASAEGLAASLAADDAKVNAFCPGLAGGVASPTSSS